MGVRQHFRISTGDWSAGPVLAILFLIVATPAEARHEACKKALDLRAKALDAANAIKSQKPAERNDCNGLARWLDRYAASRIARRDAFELVRKVCPAQVVRPYNHKDGLELIEVTKKEVAACEATRPRR
jgi:hypothetical protein